MKLHDLIQLVWGLLRAVLLVIFVFSAVMEKYAGNTLDAIYYMLWAFFLLIIEVYGVFGKGENVR